MHRKGPKRNVYICPALDSERGRQLRRLTHAQSFNSPEPQTDPGLAALPSLPVLVNHGFGVTLVRS